MHCRLLLSFLLLLLPARAHAIGPTWPMSDTPRFWILGEGLGHFSFDAYYFQSRENYNEDGLASAPANLDRTHYSNGRFHGGFGFAPKISLFAQADLRGISMSSTEAVQTAAAHASNQGLGDAFVAFRWLAYRSSATDRVYPTEWSPDSWVGVIEGSWAFPMYDSARDAKPPLGDQSNDFTGIARVAWYANEWLAFSGGSGYVYRTAGYGGLVPWNVRADFSLQERHKIRFWLDFQAFERMKARVIGAPALNPEQPDPFPNGSLLFKSKEPTIRTLNIGVGYLLSRSWELTLGTYFTASGVNHAKGWGAGGGITWRPYQVPEIKYEEYRKRQIERLQTEKREYRRRDVIKYGFRSTIVKVSAQGNYAKILYGEKDRVRNGDTFYVLPPDTLSAQARRPVASASVVQVQPDAAYLHIDERYVENLQIQEGYEARRVYFDVED